MPLPSSPNILQEGPKAPSLHPVTKLQVLTRLSQGLATALPPSPSTTELSSYAAQPLPTIDLLVPHPSPLWPLAKVI